MSLAWALDFDGIELSLQLGDPDRQGRILVFEGIAPLGEVCDFTLGVHGPAVLVTSWKPSRIADPDKAPDVNPTAKIRMLKRWRVAPPHRARPIHAATRGEKRATMAPTIPATMMVMAPMSVVLGCEGDLFDFSFMSAESIVEFINSTIPCW
jgi:hypothetical protein